MSGEGRLGRMWKSPWRVAVFAVAGALVGVAYYQVIGCRNGSCMLTGTLWRSAAYFAAVAAVVGLPGRQEKKEAPKPQA